MTAADASCKAVLFDLDGTLIDTAPDMVAALARLCAEEDRDPLDYSSARSHVSQGARGLVRLAFPDLEDDNESRLIGRFRELYAANLCEGSRLFDGMGEVLEAIETGGRSWGIVTNKPECFTLPLLAALRLDGRARCVISGDTLPRNKPDPMPMHHACELLALTPGDCIYVGDDRRDVVAGRAAGMRTVAALWGYILADDDPVNWQADAMIDHPRDISRWLEP